MFATGSQDNNASSLCVAVKRHILVYELNRTKYRHLKIKVTVKFRNYLKLMLGKNCIKFA